MAYIDIYNCPTWRDVVAAAVALGRVYQSFPQITTSPAQWSSGPDIIRIYSGPVGGPHPAFVRGQGIEDDLKTVNGIRMANAGSMITGTTVAQDPNVSIQTITSVPLGSNSSCQIWILTKESSIDGESWQYTAVNVVRFYVPSANCWICSVNSGGGTVFVS